MENEIIYGIRPIVEAMRANVKIEKVWLLKNKTNSFILVYMLNQKMFVKMWSHYRPRVYTVPIHHVV